MSFDHNKNHQGKIPRKAFKQVGQKPKVPLADPKPKSTRREFLSLILPKKPNAAPNKEKAKTSAKLNKLARKEKQPSSKNARSKKIAGKQLGPRITELEVVSHSSTLLAPTRREFIKLAGMTSVAALAWRELVAQNRENAGSIGPASQSYYCAGSSFIESPGGDPGKVGTWALNPIMLLQGYLGWCWATVPVSLSQFYQIAHSRHRAAPNVGVPYTTICALVYDTYALLPSERLPDGMYRPLRPGSGWEQDPTGPMIIPGTNCCDIAVATRDCNYGGTMPHALNRVGLTITTTINSKQTKPTLDQIATNLAAYSGNLCADGNAANTQNCYVVSFDWAANETEILQMSKSATLMAIPELNESIKKHLAEDDPKKKAAVRVGHALVVYGVDQANNKLWVANPAVAGQLHIDYSNFPQNYLGEGTDFAVWWFYLAKPDQVNNVVS